MVQGSGVAVSGPGFGGWGEEYSVHGFWFRVGAGEGRDADRASRMPLLNFWARGAGTAVSVVQGGAGFIDPGQRGVENSAAQFDAAEDALLTACGNGTQLLPSTDRGFDQFRRPAVNQVSISASSIST